MKMSKQNAYDMLIGVGILGTGGGGDPVGFGKPLVDWDYQIGRVYELTDPKDVKDDAFIVCGGYMGSVSAFTSIGDMLEQWENHTNRNRSAPSGCIDFHVNNGRF